MRTSPGSTGPFAETPLKWIGVVTLLLAVLLLLNQASKVFAEIRDRQRQVGEWQAMADQQQRAGDFQRAWASLERAAATASRGSFLARLASPPEPERQAVRTAQEDLAMAWLERASAAGGARFSDTVDPLLPALTAAPDGGGRRKADLLAHVGWAHFLKSRDGGATRRSRTVLPQALDVDPSNPYAHAHWGHWLAWKRRPSTRPPRTSTPRWRRAAPGPTSAACSSPRCSSPHRRQPGRVSRRGRRHGDEPGAGGAGVRERRLPALRPRVS
jgi:hypothetical protein